MVFAYGKPRLLVFIVAYFAEKTIENVLTRIPVQLRESYDIEALIIDDASSDNTFERALLAKRSGAIPFNVTVLHNPVNQGYGGNQKIGYQYAIGNNFDFVALLHGDGQYAPELLPDLVEPLRRGEADAVFGSRMAKPRSALEGGMPLYKYFGNRILTFAQNKLLGTKLSEFHSGYRVYSVATLKQLPFERNSNVFHFDTEIIIQLVTAGKRIKEIPIPTYYGEEICYVNGIKYAKDVLKASLQAALQGVNLFYDRRFDCAPLADGERYPSKLDFDSSHSKVVDLIPPRSRVLDLGSGMGAVGKALKDRKSCRVVGCDVERGALTAGYDGWVQVNLDDGLPEFAGEQFDYILALDIVEHLRSPEDFLDQLRELSARTGAKVILTTANIGFIVMRLSLMLGRFEYGKRGILDLTHTRLFTLKTLRRAMSAAGFDLKLIEGVVVPAPFVFGKSLLSRLALRMNSALLKLRPSLFGFQLLVVAEGRPTLETLLWHAETTAKQRVRVAMQEQPQYQLSA